MVLTTLKKPDDRAPSTPNKASTMKALVYQAIGKKALVDHPKPEITAPTDAIVRITRTTICGTDLHILKGDLPSCQPGRILVMKASALSIKSVPPSRSSSRAIMS